MARPKKDAIVLHGLTDAVRAARLKLFVTEMNRTLRKGKSPGRVDVGSDIRFVDPPRISTGILGLDIITNGGLPRGGKTQMWGPWSTGKTTTTMLACGHAQRMHGVRIFWGAVEAFSKTWGRKNGMLIPYTKTELLTLAKTMPKKADRIAREQKNWPAFVVGMHTHGDALLEMTYEAVKSNSFDIVVVDSLGGIKRYADIKERSVEDQKYGGEAGLFGHFSNKIYSAMNTRYDPETGEPMEETIGDNWVGNTTALVCVNQAREKIGYNPSGQTQYKPVGGQALLHLWDLSVLFTHGPKKSEKKGDEKTTYAIEVRAKVAKSKICPPEMEAEWDLYVRNHKQYRAGTIDSAADVFYWGKLFDMFEQSGSNYYIEGERCKGADGATTFLRENDEVRNAIYAACVAEGKKRNL